MQLFNFSRKKSYTGPAVLLQSNSRQLEMWLEKYSPPQLEFLKEILHDSLRESLLQRTEVLETRERVFGRCTILTTSQRKYLCVQELLQPGLLWICAYGDISGGLIRNRCQMKILSKPRN